MLVIVPVVNVFDQALSRGVGTYWHNLFGDANTRHAILLTLTVAPAAVLSQSRLRRGMRLGDRRVSASPAAPCC